MRIDGSDIASHIYEDLKKKVEKLRKKNIIPHLAVLVVGNDPASHAYVLQKQKRGSEIGILVTVQMYGEDATTELLLREVLLLNQDPMTHGIVVQQPLPSHVNTKQIVDNTDPKKDVDGFCAKSKFTPPISEAALRVLDVIRTDLDQGPSLIKWLNAKQVTVVGKGETGGAPIIAKLKSLNVEPQVVDSKTKDPKAVLQNADIVISCVGKAGVIKPKMLKWGSILIGIGMFRGEDGKLHADYEEDEIKDIVGYYTPVPGGIGPINVAMLLQNVLLAAER